MAKVIKYLIPAKVKHGAEVEQIFRNVVIGWNEGNEEIAKAEAYNGEYTIEDDGRPEPAVKQSQEERIKELEDALEMLLSGVTE